MWVFDPVYEETRKKNSRAKAGLGQTDPYTYQTTVWAGGGIKNSSAGWYKDDRHHYCRHWERWTQLT